MIEIKRLNVDQFSKLEEEWDKLLSKTKSDKLFLSWTWMYNWWLHCSTEVDELLLLVAYNDQKLVGIAPLFKAKQRVKYFFNSTRIMLIGTNPEGHDAFRAEYLEFIVQPQHEHVVPELYKYIIDNIKFSEIYFQELVFDSVTYKYLQLLRGYKRHLGIGSTFVIKTSGSFNDFLNSLGKRTRIKSYNQRNKLKCQGDLKLDYVNSGNIEFVFELLYEFQKDRWNIGKSDLNKRKIFLERLLASPNIIVSGVVLFFNATPIACTLNLNLGNRVYNFQLAYQQGFDNKFSLGFLIAVYDAELYFKDNNVEFFDLLEGKGKSKNYKSHIAIEDKDLVAITVIRNHFYSVIYRIYDCVANIQN
jgi:predicted N-acyltransferase